ncbi:MAG: hypothetical protein FWH32_00010 [Clostridiales bacterium]|nr:hypothetical protein [Clostridiales bacterium]
MTHRRIALAYWVAAIGFFVPSAAYAYIDPATTTYIVQIITALVVMLGVSLSIFLYKFNMASARVKYGLYAFWHRVSGRAATPPDASRDAGVGTYVLPSYAMADAVYPPSDADMAVMGEPFDMAKIPLKPLEADLGARGYGGRLKAALPVAMAVPLSFVFIGCLDLAVQNWGDIPFRPGAMVSTLLLVTAICFAVLLLVLAIFRGKAFHAMVSLAFAVLVAGYIQGSFMNSGLGELTGEAINWGQYLALTAGSVAMWAIVFVCVFLLLRYARKAWRGAIIFVPVLLLVMQASGLSMALYDYSRYAEQPFWAKPEEMLTIEGLRNPASDRNAIIFVLDQLDEGFVKEIEEYRPGFFDVLDGFTKFDDNISHYADTFPAVTSLLTGIRYEYDQPREDYFNYAWANAEMLSRLKERGVDVRLFMDIWYAYGNVGQLKGIANNINMGQIDFDKRIAFVKLAKLSGFRYAPMPIKERFWISPTEFGDTLRQTGDNAFFMTNDFAFYDNITSFGLSPSDAETGFFYYHLQGAHVPFIMDENINRVEAVDEDGQARTSQTMGAFRIVFEYLEQLRGLGLYERATIVITGDHPDFVRSELQKPAHTALFVKPSGRAGVPLAYSHAPVSPRQLSGTVMDGIFGDRGDFAAGYMDMGQGADSVRTYDTDSYRYEIIGNGNDFANWRLVGERQEGGW